MGARLQRLGQFFRRFETDKGPNKHDSLIRRKKESGAWLCTKAAAVVVGLALVIATAITFSMKSEDRQTQRIAQAWQLVNKSEPGDSGKGPVLEFLNSQQISLKGVDLSGAQLGDADLSGANLLDANLSEAFLFNTNLSEGNLTNANLSEANLYGSNLTGAKLNAANLSGAYLIIANLSEANLSNADLSKAFLQGTNLSGAYLIEANLSGVFLQGSNLLGAYLSDADLSAANLSSSRNLSQIQLDKACGNDKTRLPEGLTIKACPE